MVQLHDISANNRLSVVYNQTWNFPFSSASSLRLSGTLSYARKKRHIINSLVYYYLCCNDTSHTASAKELRLGTDPRYYVTPCFVVIEIWMPFLFSLGLYVRLPSFWLHILSLPCSSGSSLRTSRATPGSLPDTRVHRTLVSQLALHNKVPAGEYWQYCAINHIICLEK